jgi:hypothetical protein
MIINMQALRYGEENERIEVHSGVIFTTIMPPSYMSAGDAVWSKVENNQLVDTYFKTDTFRAP